MTVSAAYTAVSQMEPHINFGSWRAVIRSTTSLVTGETLGVHVDANGQQLSGMVGTMTVGTVSTDHGSWST